MKEIYEGQFIGVIGVMLPLTIDDVRFIQEKQLGASQWFKAGKVAEAAIEKASKESA